jgi:iron(III) transport system ATP-binding protein
MVFQDGALFPHLTVARNVAFGKPRPGRVEEMLSVVGLADRAGAYPHELSGGERQRVALARAMATDPAVVLLDEPFASLDAGLRSSLRVEVAAILRAAGASALFVTHDQQEALSLADSIVVMRDGLVMQVGAPEEIYARPATRWVAEFLGTVDVLPGTARCGVVTCELGRFPADDDGGVGDLAGAVDVLVRPEAVTIASLDGGDVVADPDVVATVVARDFYGADQIVTVRLPSGRLLRSRRAGFGTWEIDASVRVAIDGPVRALPIDAA